jgi:hypothetical protein
VVGLWVLVGLTALEMVAGRVLTGAGNGMGWLEGWVLGVVLLGAGVVVVVPTGGLETVVVGVVGVGLEMVVLVVLRVGLEIVVLGLLVWGWVPLAG